MNREAVRVDRRFVLSGAVLPAPARAAAGLPRVVALVTGVLALMAAAALAAWREQPSPPEQLLPITADRENRSP